MEKISRELDIKQHLTSKNKNLRQDLTSWQVKQVVESVPFVTNQWLPYHCKAVNQLGPNKYLELADMARKAKHPASLLSYLLKQEMQ